MKNKLFTGVATALATPFIDEKINFKVFEEFIELQINSGINALVVCGTTGEASTMSQNEKIDLTLKEFELLKLLALNRGKVLTRNYLLDKIWGYEYFGETRTVDVHIRHLRKKIEDNDKKPQYIETIRGVGYKIK